MRFRLQGTISKLTDEAREYIGSDIIRSQRYPENQISLINGIFSRYELRNSRSSPRAREKELKYDEQGTPTRPRRWNSDLSKIADPLAPDQDMANVSANEFRLAGRKDPLTRP